MLGYILQYGQGLHLQVDDRLRQVRHRESEVDDDLGHRLEEVVQHVEQVVEDLRRPPPSPAAS